MVERFTSNMLGSLAGCLIWLPIAIIVVSLVHWMVQAEIDPLSGLLGIGASLFLGFVALQPPLPWVGTAAFFAVSILVVTYPAIRFAVNRRELAMVDVEDVVRLYEELGERPGNVSVQFRLAKILYTRGYAGHAITIADQCLLQMPKSLFSNEHRMVAGWKKAASNPEYFRPLPCMQCGQMNQVGTIYCGRCQAPYFRDLLAGKWLAGSLTRKLLAVWVAMVIGAVAIPVLAQRMSREGIVIVAPLLVVLAILGIVLAFRSRE